MAFSLLIPHQPHMSNHTSDVPLNFGSFPHIPSRSRRTIALFEVGISSGWKAMKIQGARRNLKMRFLYFHEHCLNIRASRLKADIWITKHVHNKTPKAKNVVIIIARPEFKLQRSTKKKWITYSYIYFGNLFVKVFSKRGSQPERNCRFIQSAIPSWRQRLDPVQ